MLLEGFEATTQDYELQQATVIEVVVTEEMPSVYPKEETVTSSTSTDPGAVPNNTDQPVVTPPQEGVSQEEDWMTGPNPEGHVVEVPVYPTPPPPPPVGD